MSDSAPPRAVEHATLGGSTRRSARSSPRTGDQRTRLLEAIVEIVGESGIAAAKVGEIAERARVSRATFYDLFTDKESCFIAAHDLLASELLERFEGQLAPARPASAAQCALGAITQLAQSQPRALTFLTHESLLAGPAARERHDRLLLRLERAVERASRTAEDANALPNVPTRILLGGTLRLCCLQLRRHGQLEAGLEPALQAWVETYTASPQERDRRALLSTPSAATALQAGAKRSLPRLLPRGRHKLPREVVAAMQRERLAVATAEVVSRCGGTSVAVSDIVAAAAVSREVFYQHFSDKEEAFLAVHQLIFEQLMAASSSAFFTPGLSWPERIWRAGCAFAGTLVSNPSFANFTFVSAYGIGEEGVQRVDETALAFGLFLEEGYRQSETAAALPRVISDAVALAAIEVAAFAIRNGQMAELHRLVSAVVYAALAPFIGPHAAGELVDRNRSADLTA